MWTFIVVFVLLTAGYSTQAYDNSVGGNLYRCCPYKQVVSQIKSSYSSYDRRWRIECMPLDTDLSCSWTDFFNLYEKELNFNCPDNGVIRGLRSNYAKCPQGQTVEHPLLHCSQTDHI
ncbi:dermatopontin-like [Lates calcarifer]|uniref:Dermatopontin-like n=1 Tax=Lates calcarifer TaxID=8187 RepID=A0AAJ7LZL5_LATCA|nr:dermatopontin-like [Lates calcarifer]